MVEESGYLYTKVYCARGDMENKIKEQKLLFSDRTSCNDWYANQFRLVLSGLAYVLLDGLRRIGLNDTILSKSQVNTIRLKILKIGGVITRNTRRIKIMLSSAFPMQSLYIQIASTICSQK